MKINANLDQYEVEALFNILNHEIIKFGPESKLRFLSKEISQWQRDWDESHKKFLEGIRDKLLGKQKS